MAPVVRRALLAVALTALAVTVPACTLTAGSAASAPGKPTSTAAAASGQASVPMTVITHGQSVLETVPVYVDGHGPFPFMLDTGSSISSVTAQLAARLHLRDTGQSAQVSGVTGTSTAPMVLIPSWRLGGYQLSSEPVAVLASASSTVSGLLGSDELRRFGAITLDFSRSLLLLSST